MIEKILVGHDGSEGAEAAFEFALDMAKRYRAEVSVLSVTRLPEPPDEEETQAVVEAAQARNAHLLSKLKAKAKAARVALEARTAVGHPAEHLVEAARREDVDLVVLGHRHRSALGRWILGSTSDLVMDHAGCSVIVVKGTKAA